MLNGSVLAHTRTSCVQWGFSICLTLDLCKMKACSFQMTETMWTSNGIRGYMKHCLIALSRLVSPLISFGLLLNGPAQLERHNIMASVAAQISAVSVITQGTAQTHRHTHLNLPKDLECFSQKVEIWAPSVRTSLLSFYVMHICAACWQSCLAARRGCLILFFLSFSSSADLLPVVALMLDARNSPNYWTYSSFDFMLAPPFKQDQTSLGFLTSVLTHSVKPYLVHLFVFCCLPSWISNARLLLIQKTVEWILHFHVFLL